MKEAVSKISRRKEICYNVVKKKILKSLLLSSSPHVRGPECRVSRNNMLEQSTRRKHRNGKSREFSSENEKQLHLPSATQSA